MNVVAHRGRMAHCLREPADVSDDTSVEYFEDGLLVIVDGHISALAPAESLLHTLSNDVEVVELHALTKLYPIGPQGASFLTGSADTMQQISTYAEFAWSPMSGLQMEATTWCFRDRSGRAEIREFFRSQLAALRDVLVDIGLTPYPIAGGIYALCEVPEAIAGKPVSSAEEAAIILMDEFDIAVVPWDPEPNHYLRFTSMYRPEDLEKLAAMGKVLELN